MDELSEPGMQSSPCGGHTRCWLCVALSHMYCPPLHPSEGRWGRGEAQVSACCDPTGVLEDGYTQGNGSL